MFQSRKRILKKLKEMAEEDLEKYIDTHERDNREIFVEAPLTRHELVECSNADEILEFMKGYGRDYEDLGDDDEHFRQCKDVLCSRCVIIGLEPDEDLPREYLVMKLVKAYNSAK